MGARSEITVVDQPWPVVFEALVNCLPTAGFTITAVDAERGHLQLETRNTRIRVAVGAVDAITSEWVATAELKIGIFRDRHTKYFAEIGNALDRYLEVYYRVSW